MKINMRKICAWIYFLSFVGALVVHWYGLFVIAVLVGLVWSISEMAQ